MRSMGVGLTMTQEGDPLTSKLQSALTQAGNSSICLIQFGFNL